MVNVCFLKLLNKQDGALGPILATRQHSKDARNFFPVLLFRICQISFELTGCENPILSPCGEHIAQRMTMLTKAAEIC